MSRNHRLKWYLSHSWSKHINHLQQEPWCWFRQVQHLLLCHCCGRRDSLCWDSRRQFEPDHSWTRSKYDPQCLRQCEVRCCHIIWPSSRDWAIWVTNRCSCCCLVTRHLRPRSSRCAFGDYEFTGELPRTWFKTVDQLPMNVGDSHYDPLFPYDFGLTTKHVNASYKICFWRTISFSVSCNVTRHLAESWFLLCFSIFEQIVVWSFS